MTTLNALYHDLRLQVCRPSGSFEEECNQTQRLDKPRSSLSSRTPSLSRIPPRSSGTIDILVASPELAKKQIRATLIFILYGALNTAQ